MQEPFIYGLFVLIAVISLLAGYLLGICHNQKRKEKLELELLKQHIDDPMYIPTTSVEFYALFEARNELERREVFMHLMKLIDAGTLVRSEEMIRRTVFSKKI